MRKENSESTTPTDQQVQLENDISILDVADDPASLQKLAKKDLVSLILRSQVEYSGPLPPPNALKKYEEAQPGAADRIIKMAEEQSHHRQNAEMKILQANENDSKRGTIAALIISIVIVGCGTTIILLNPEIGGYICGSLMNLFGIATVIRAFLKTDKSSEKKKEDE